MKYSLILILFLLTINVVGQKKQANDPEVIELVECLNQNSADPKEYILDLFEKNDIVIIGERDHRDTTQYDLLLDIISDKRFIEKVGHVYTEVGCINRTDWANQVLKAEYSSEEEFETELIKLYRELDFNPLWEKYNMYKYLKGIYRINKALNDENKITVGLTDIAFDWDRMTRKKYIGFRNDMNAWYRKRDSIMANNFMQLYEQQYPINGKKKALLIQSRPHSRNMDVKYKGLKLKYVGSYIKDAYGDKVKIIVFNWYKWMPVEWEYWAPPKKNELTDNGKWDAAFEVTGCKSVAFDFDDTPFGKTEFDYAYETGVTFQDIFDGIIFYKPFYEFVGAKGVPGVVDNEFSKELVKREAIVDRKFFNRLGLRLFSFHFRKSSMNYYNNVTTFQCDDYESMKRQMDQWIE